MSSSVAGASSAAASVGSFPCDDKLFSVSDDPRMKHILRKVSFADLVSSAGPREDKDPGDKGKVAVIGFPSDEGTLRNGGRGGGYRGPECFRKFRTSHRRL